MSLRTCLRSVAALLGIGLVVVPASAFRDPDTTPVSAKAYRHADLYIGNVYVPVEAVDASKMAAANQALARLGGSPATAKIDYRSGRFGTLLAAKPLLPGTGVGNDLAWAKAPSSLPEHQRLAREAFLGYLSSHASDLGIDLNEIGGVKATVHDNGNLVQMYVNRQYDGIPVRDSYINGVINHGNLVLMGLTKWGDINLASSPQLDKSGAESVLFGHLGSLNPTRMGKAQLVIVPMAEGTDYRASDLGQGYGYRLVWSLNPKFDNEMGDWEALVDAHTGELLAFQDTTNYAQTRGGASTREVKGGVYPITNDGVGPQGTEQPGWPMPYAYATNGGVTRTATTGGQVLACLAGELTTDLTGPYLTIIDNTCGAVAESSLMEPGDDLDLASGPGTNCTVPAGHSVGDTHAARSGFYELNRIIEMGRGHLPSNSWLQQPLGSEMNIALNCNATGGPGGLRFYQAGGGCANTGELAGVFDHEWGHGMDGSDAMPFISSPGEGIADIYASLRFNESCIGHNFLPSPCGGYGNPCNTCSGVRDIDWANRANNTPTTLAWIDANCGSGPSPCGGGVHCEGAIYGEVVWDLWNRKLPADSPAGNDDRRTAREMATRLTFAGAGGVGNWYSCVNGTGTGDGCNGDGGYLNYLAADDDNGNLSDGTPNMLEIFAAFDDHDIACPTPTVQASGCAGAPTAEATNLSATARDRGVALDWDPVPNATRYKVYRTEGLDTADGFGHAYGKTPIAETTDTEYVDDSGLMNGRTYYYSVIGFSASDQCHGPMALFPDVTPVAGGNFAVDASTIAVSMAAGDGDPFFDNCEAADITFDVANIGTGALTGLEIVSVESTSHPNVVPGMALPSTIANSVSACGIREATVRVSGSGMAHNDTVDLVIGLTANEFAGTKFVEVSIPFVESDLQVVASQTFSFEADYEGWTVTEGTFDRNGSQGGSAGSNALNSSNGLPNQCDRVTSPVIIPTGTTTLSLSTNYDIEGGVPWYDRANVALLETAGTRHAVAPDGGHLYSATGAYGGCNQADGWAGTTNVWNGSTFSAAALGSGGLSGTPLQIEVTYGTDGGLHPRGFAFDEVTIDNFELQVADAGPDCAVGGIFSDGFESGDTSAW